MKKITFILILVFIAPFYSCSKDNDTNEKQNPSQNGFTFNSEFSSTNELLTAFTPGEAYFFIIDDASEFNVATRTFAGASGRIIFIQIPFAINEAMDVMGTYTNAVQSNGEEITDVSFAAALMKDVSSIDAIFSGENVGSETILLANTGKVTMSFDADTSVFTLDYTFTTNEGTVTGAHKSGFTIIE